MAQLTPYGEYLLLGKLSNTLNENEVRALNLLWQEDPDLAIAYEQLVQQLPADKVKSGFQEADEPVFWDDLGARFRRQTTVQAQPAVPPRRLFFKKIPRGRDGYYFIGNHDHRICLAF